jgi:DNA-binding CsgD family transcriptional regulator
MSISRTPDDGAEATCKRTQIATARDIADNEAERIWRRVAAGAWTTLVAVDANRTRHAVMGLRLESWAIDWPSLSPRETQVLALTACNCPAKAIAVRLGLSPTSVSSAMRSARERLGLHSNSRLVRAYCASAQTAPAVHVLSD